MATKKDLLRQIETLINENTIYTEVRVPVPVETIVYVDRPVETVRVVDREVEVPVVTERVTEVRVPYHINDGIIERVVERVVEVPVDRIINTETLRVDTQIREVPVDVVREVILESVVEVPVDRPVSYWVGDYFDLILRALNKYWVFTRPITREEFISVLVQADNAGELTDNITRELFEDTWRAVESMQRLGFMSR